jgi:hypothetical protein
MKGQMELRKKLYTPAWRDPKLLRKAARESRLRPIMGILTAACLLCLVAPGDGQYSKAISIQLSQGGFSARALFFLMFLVLGYFASRLWAWGSRLAASVSIGTMAGLACIAFTNPFSQVHNTAFLFVAIASVFGNVALYFSYSGIFLTSLGSLAGLMLCPFNLGVGERLLVASSCLSLAIIYYGDLDP